MNTKCLPPKTAFGDLAQTLMSYLEKLTGLKKTKGITYQMNEAQITEEYLDYLVDMWHGCSYINNAMSMQEYIQDMTRMSDEEYERWMVKGIVPSRN